MYEFLDAMNLYSAAVVITAISFVSAGVTAVWQVQKRKMLRRDPRLILDERLAKGEIDEAEYSRRVNLLRLGPPIELGWQHSELRD